MNEKRKFRQVSIAEVLVWPLPALLAAFAHLYAYPKAGMSGSGPGFHIALMNEETITAQQAWHFINSLLPYPFLLYALLLVTVFALLRMKHVRVLYRIAVFVLLAVPGFWYFTIEAYLGGKLLKL